MVTSPGSPSPPTAPFPPPIPQIDDIDPALVNYLRAFALWAQQSLAGKLNANQALPLLMLQGNNAPQGTAPNVWTLEVTNAGVFQFNQVPLGGGRP